VTKAFSLDQYDSTIEVTDADWWAEFKNETPQERLQRLEDTYLGERSSADIKRAGRKGRRQVKKHIKTRVDHEHGYDEMCGTYRYSFSSCYLLEKDEPDGKLLKYGSCRLVKYCQKDNWKTQKKQCTGRK
jgi:hypothetical protein